MVLDVLNQALDRVNHVLNMDTRTVLLASSSASSASASTAPSPAHSSHSKSTPL
jgi:hypothetical protein